MISATFTLPPPPRHQCALPPVRPYKDYLAWVARQDREAAEPRHHHVGDDEVRPAGLQQTLTSELVAHEYLAGIAVLTAVQDVLSGYGALSSISVKATSAATTAILAGARFVDLQHPTANFFAVKLVNRRRRFFVSRHFDERETLRLSGVAVFDYLC